MSQNTKTVARRPEPAVRATGGNTRGRDRGLVAALVGVVAVLVSVGTGIGVALSSGHGGKPEPVLPITDRQAPADVVAETTGVAVSVMTEIGAPSFLPRPQYIAGQPALRDGAKPALFFAGAEYCPYCGVERWALVQALSRFGTFHGLRITRSARQDDFPGTWSFSFHGTSFSSPYVAFAGVELYSNWPLPGIRSGYHMLDAPSAQQQSLLNTYDPPPYYYDDGLPFLDFGNRFFVRSPQFSPALLAGLDTHSIAARLSNPTDPVAINILGSANIMTAAICDLTAQQPASVCGSPVIRELTKSLRHRG